MIMITTLRNSLQGFISPKTTPGFLWPFLLGSKFQIIISHTSTSERNDKISTLRNSLQGFISPKTTPWLICLFLLRSKFQIIILISFSLIAAAFCSPVPVPPNGTVQGYRYELGATLRISCDTGYNLVPESSSFRTCVPDNQGGGEWSGVDPVCECMFIVEKLYINTSLSPCHLTRKYARPRTSSAPRSEQFSSSYTLGNLFASGNRHNVRGHITEHFFASRMEAIVFIIV